MNSQPRSDHRPPYSVAIPRNRTSAGRAWAWRSPLPESDSAGTSWTLPDDPVEDPPDPGQVVPLARDPGRDGVVEHAVFDVPGVADRELGRAERLDDRLGVLAGSARRSAGSRKSREAGLRA